jgi:hypothetical protein
MTVQKISVKVNFDHNNFDCQIMNLAALSTLVATHVVSQVEMGLSNI